MTGKELEFAEFLFSDLLKLQDWIRLLLPYPRSRSTGDTEGAHGMS